MSNKLKFLQIKNQADKGALYIYGDIVDDSWNVPDWFGNNPSDTFPLDIKDALDEFDGKPIDVHINSAGGHAYAGLAIANMLKRYKGDTTCYVDGLAASAASLIALACKKTVVSSGAMLMIHNPIGYCEGNAADMLATATSLETCGKAFADFYAERAADGVTADSIKAMMDAETWLDGKTAAATFGGVEITNTSQIAACAKSKLFERYKNIPTGLKVEGAKSEPKTEEINKQKNERLSAEIDIALAI